MTDPQLAALADPVPDSLVTAARHTAPWYGITTRWYFAMMNPAMSRRARALNLAFAGLDMGEWLLLRRSTAAGLTWRLPLHVLDEAVFSAVEPSGYLVAVSSARGPLALESTVRWGAIGLLVPAAGSVAVPLLSRRPVSLDSAGWPFVAGLAGLLSRHIRKGRLARYDLEHAEWLDAEIGAAELMGRHSVAMGADSVVDRLEALAPLLDRPAAGSALERLLDAWKASLGSQVSGRASYLGTELLRWERLRNLDPDLAARVQLVVAEGDGTELLGAAQAKALVDALDALDPRGRVLVGVAGGGPRITTADPVVLRIGDRLVHLAASPTPLPATYDPTPVAFAVAAITLLFEASADRSAAPIGVLVPPAVAYAAAAWWSHRRLTRVDTPATRSRIVTAAVGLGAIGSTATILARRNRFTPGGMPDLGAIALLEGPLMAAAWSWDRLPPRTCAWVSLGFAGTVAGVVAMAGRPRSWRALAAEVGFLVTAFGTWRRVPRLIEAEVDARRTAAAESDRAARAVAHERGRRRVIDLVAAACNDARAGVASTPGMADDLRAEANRRLAEVAARLEELRCAGS